MRGQLRPVSSTNNAQAATGRCTSGIQRHRAAIAAPKTANRMNARWINSTASAASRKSMIAPAQWMMPNEAVEKVFSYSHRAVNQNKYQGQATGFTEHTERMKEIGRASCRERV